MGNRASQLYSSLQQERHRELVSLIILVGPERGVTPLPATAPPPAAGTDGERRRGVQHPRETRPGEVFPQQPWLALLIASQL